MTRSRFSLALFLAILWLSHSLPAAAEAEESASPRPNILFILSDDQGWSSLSCYGNKEVPTPHLDRLATQGVRFTDAYVMPQCTPTRAALFTGQHTARTGMWHVLTNPWYGYPWAPVQEPPYREQLPREWATLPKQLHAAGYATGMAGKWHLTANEDGNYIALKPQAATAYGFDFVAPPGDGPVNKGDKWVDHLTDAAIGFVKVHRENPWFFYLAHHTLHGVVSAPAHLIKKHREQRAPETGLNNATYLAAIEHLDASVGRLLAVLDEMKLQERTIVVFLSDNGGVSHSYDPKPFTTGPGIDTQLKIDKEEFSNQPLRGPKGSPYEGGIRVPCIVRWPGVVQAGRTEKTPIHIVDWLPTLLAAAEVPAADDPIQDGVNLVPLLQGKPLAARSLYWHVPLYDLRWGATPCAMMRKGDWKLIEFFGDRFDADGKYHGRGHLQLFNLADDLAEAHDLAAQQLERTQQLRTELHKFLADCGAKIPEKNPHYDATKPFKEASEKPAFVPEYWGAQNNR